MHLFFDRAFKRYTARLSQRIFFSIFNFFNEKKNLMITQSKKNRERNVDGLNSNSEHIFDTGIEN